MAPQFMYIFTMINEMIGNKEFENKTFPAHICCGMEYWKHFITRVIYYAIGCGYDVHVFNQNDKCETPVIMYGNMQTGTYHIEILEEPTSIICCGTPHFRDCDTTLPIPTKRYNEPKASLELIYGLINDVVDKACSIMFDMDTDANRLLNAKRLLRAFCQHFDSFISADNKIENNLDHNDRVYRNVGFYKDELVIHYYVLRGGTKLGESSWCDNKFGSWSIYDEDDCEES